MDSNYFFHFKWNTIFWKIYYILGVRSSSHKFKLTDIKICLGEFMSLIPQKEKRKDKVYRLLKDLTSEGLELFSEKEKIGYEAGFYLKN